MRKRIRFNRRFFIIVGVLLFLFLVWFFFFRHGKQTTYNVRNFTLKEEAGIGSCKYSAVYEGKTIDLGTYNVSGGCKTTQSVVANKMLAVAAGHRTFLYNPSTKKIAVLEPSSLKKFQEYANEKNIDVSDYTQRRYIMAGSSWQIIYTPDAKVKTQTPRIVFSTTNAGKTFVFSPSEQ